MAGLASRWWRYPQGSMCVYLAKELTSLPTIEELEGEDPEPVF